MLSLLIITLHRELWEGLFYSIFSNLQYNNVQSWSILTRKCLSFYKLNNKRVISIQTNGGLRCYSTGKEEATTSQLLTKSRLI